MKSIRNKKTAADPGAIIPGRPFVIPILNPLRTKLYPVTRGSGDWSGFPYVLALLEKHKLKEELLAWIAEVRWRSDNHAWPLSHRDLMDVLWLHRGQESIDAALAAVVKKVLFDDTVSIRFRPPSMSVVGPVVTATTANVDIAVREAAALAHFIDGLRIGEHVAIMHRMERERWYAEHCLKKIKACFRTKLDQTKMRFKV